MGIYYLTLARLIITTPLEYHGELYLFGTLAKTLPTRFIEACKGGSDEEI